MEILNWSTLGSRILELTQQAVQMQREEEGTVVRGPEAPFLRLVKVDEWESDEVDACETGSAA